MLEARSRRTSLALSAAAFLAVASAMTAFSVLFDEGQWGPTVLAVVAAIIVAAAVVRATARRAARVWSVFAALGALVVALTLIFAADTALVGVVPLPDTFQRFSQLITAGELSIAEQAIPAAADDGIRFVLAASIGVLALMVEATATMSRRPAFAAIPLLGILAVPIILVPGALPLLSVLATSAAYLLLLAVHRPAASGGGAAASRALAVGAAVLVAALVVPPLLPPVVAGATPSGTGIAGLVTGINPVIELGNDLRRANPVTALRYSTEGEGGVYLALSLLADFEGDGVQPVLEGVDGALDVVGPPAWLGAQVATTSIETRIQLENVRSRWVPLPSAPVTVGGLDGQWRLSADGVTVSTTAGTVRQGSYTVQSLVSEPTPLQLRSAGVGAAGLNRYRAIPENLDPIIAETARQVAAGAEGDSPYDQALALQRYFTGGDFTYSEEAPVELGYDGTSADIIAVFLQARSGYCVHYASAMTLLARSLGIPARIAVGFLPGVRNPDVPSEFVVTTDDLHAWPELHFDGVGWVRFEPTPSRGTVPLYASVDVPAPGEEPAIDPETGAEITPTADPADPTATGEPVDRLTGPDGAPDPSSLIDGGSDGTNDGGIEGSAAPVVDARVLATALLAILGALVVGAGAWRVVRRVARLRSADPLEQWREVRDTARDLGLETSPERTPRQLVAGWAAGWAADDRARLDAVREALEARAFARPHHRAPARDVGVVLGLLRASTPWWRRAVAAVAPLSLLDREPRVILDSATRVDLG